MTEERVYGQLATSPAQSSGQVLACTSILDQCLPVAAADMDKTSTETQRQRQLQSVTRYIRYYLAGEGGIESESLRQVNAACREPFFPCWQCLRANTRRALALVIRDSHNSYTYFNDSNNSIVLFQDRRQSYTTCDAPTAPSLRTRHAACRISCKSVQPRWRTRRRHTFLLCSKCYTMSCKSPQDGSIPWPPNTNRPTQSHEEVAPRISCNWRPTRCRNCH